MRRFVDEHIRELLPLELIDIARMLGVTKSDLRLVWKRQRAFLNVEPGTHFGILPEQRHEVIRTKFIHRPPEDETRRVRIFHSTKQHHRTAAFGFPPPREPPIAILVAGLVSTRS